MHRKEIEWSLSRPKGHDIRFPSDRDTLLLMGKYNNKVIVGRISVNIEFFSRLRTLRDKIVKELLDG